MTRLILERLMSKYYGLRNFIGFAIVCLLLLGQNSCAILKKDNWEKTAFQNLEENMKTLPKECLTDFQSYQEVWKEEITKIPIKQHLVKIEQHIKSVENIKSISIVHRIRAGYDMENILGTLIFIEQEESMEGFVYKENNLNEIANARCKYEAGKDLKSGCDFSLNIMSYYDTKLRLLKCEVTPNTELSILDQKLGECVN